MFHVTKSRSILNLYRYIHILYFYTLAEGILIVGKSLQRTLGDISD